MYRLWMQLDEAAARQSGPPTRCGATGGRRDIRHNVTETRTRGIVDIMVQRAPTAWARPDFGKMPANAKYNDAAEHKLLLVATSYMLPYRVLRCAKSCGAEVYVLGGLGAQVLQLSRYCDKFIRSHRIINGSSDAALALEINVLTRNLGITTILAGDAPSTRSLIACRDLLDAPCFPLPGLEQFDQLNDKRRFAQLCQDIGLPHPTTRSFETIAELSVALERNHSGHPVVLKPLSLSGNQGVIRLVGHDTAEQIRRLDYEPILMQDFVAGRDMSVSIYCHRGTVQAFVLHQRQRRIFKTFWSQAIFDEMTHIASRLALDGVFNFDMIVDENGLHYYLECNPRFFFSISLAMLAGLNFITLGLRGDCGDGLQTIRDGTAVRSPEAVIAAPWTWLKIKQRDLKSAAFVLSDPLPMIFDQLGWPT